MVPQNMLVWHNGYSELKVFEKQQVKEECADLPFSS